MLAGTSRDGLVENRMQEPLPRFLDDRCGSFQDLGRVAFDLRSLGQRS